MMFAARLALAVLLATPAGTPVLTVDDRGAGTELGWTALHNAPLYDLARGSLGTLRATGSLTAAAQDCLQNDRMPRAAVDGEVPLEGDGFWYVVHGVNCDGERTYDSGDPAQAGPRDADIEASGQCIPPPCTPGYDVDFDGLDECAETDTGLWCGPDRTGTNPGLSDTDGDSLRDGDEVLGTPGGLNLPGMGANPLRRDLFLEYDWFDDSLECSPHSHRPTQAMVDATTTAFAAAPLINPDGSTGVVLHHDRGQGGLFSGGNLVADADGVLTNGVNSSEFIAIKNANFAANRNGYFHYVLLPHRHDTNSTSSGQAEIRGDDFLVSLYCAFSTKNVARTIVHELGHNLNLRHGGDTNCNYKPNYNSVMNYRYQFPGVDTDCTPPANGLLDYSRGVRIDLDENALNEFAGICGGPAWDWDGDGLIESLVSTDINSSDTSQASNCGGTYTLLRDFNDWAAILFTGLSDGDRPILPPEIITCDNPAPPEKDPDPND